MTRVFFWALGSVLLVRVFVPRPRRSLHTFGQAEFRNWEVGVLQFCFARQFWLFGSLCFPVNFQVSLLISRKKRSGALTVSL